MVRYTIGLLTALCLGGSLLSGGQMSRQRESEVIELPQEEIEALQIDWLDGSITIEAYDGDTVQFYEECDTELTEKTQMQYALKKGKLSIRYTDTKGELFKTEQQLDKSLTVLLPRQTEERPDVSERNTDTASSRKNKEGGTENAAASGAWLRDLKISAVSSQISVEGAAAYDADLENVSGDIVLQDCQFEDLDVEVNSGDLYGEEITVWKGLDLETISGKTEISGSFNKVDYEGVSGEFELESEICPREVDASTVSGDIRLIIPDNDGFSYEMETVSGTFRCDFEVTERGDDGFYKDGRSEFSFESVSGAIAIQKRQE